MARVTKQQRRTTRVLLDVAGRTYAQEAGIRLRDTPAALYQLLVLSMLLGTRIKAELAVAAARELTAAGWTTPRRMRDGTWQQRVDALGRAHYTRYDESTATRLEDGASLLLDVAGGDVRRLVGDDHDAAAASAALERVPGVGPVSAAIFLREAQAVWAWLRPFADDRVTGAAQQFGLPGSAAGLHDLAGHQDLSQLGAALVRWSLDRDVRARVRRHLDDREGQDGG